MKRLSVAILVAVVATLLVVPTTAQAEGKLTTVWVKAHDYHFEGIPKTLDVGLHKFFFNNKGENPHMLVLFKNNSFLSNKEALKKAMKDEEWAERKIKFIGEAFAKAGEKGEPFTAWLKPGKYMGLCFAQDSKDSAPHFTLGMVHNMRVEK